MRKSDCLAAPVRVVLHLVCLMAYQHQNAHNLRESTGAPSPTGRTTGELAAVRATLYTAAVPLGPQTRTIGRRRRGPGARGSRAAGAEATRVPVRCSAKLSRLAAHGDAQQVARFPPAPPRPVGR